MATILLCAALAVVLLAPETTVGKWLRYCLVEWPAHKLAQLKPSHLAAGCAGLGVILLIVAYAKAEGAMVIALGIPDGLAWFTMFDVAAYLDVAAVIAVLAVTVRLRVTHDVLRSWAVRARQWALRFLQAGRPRQGHGARRRSLRGRPKRSPSSKDEDAAWAGAWSSRSLAAVGEWGAARNSTMSSRSFSAPAVMRTFGMATLMLSSPAGPGQR